MKKIEIALSCGHQFEVQSRPNPRKEWPDPQICPTCKRKFRVGYIHTWTVDAKELAKVKGEVKKINPTKQKRKASVRRKK